MTSGDPGHWDELSERVESTEAEPYNGDVDHQGEPPVVSLFAACWADLVAMVAVMTGVLVTLVAFGYEARPEILPWAGGVALCWWWLSATATVAVRRATPGMLLAGLAVERQVPPRRVPSVVIAALIGCLSLGLLALLGPRRSLISAAAGSDLAALPR